MSNNYQQFSEIIPYKTQKQKDWLATALIGDDEGNLREMTPCVFEVEDEGIWVYADESGDLEALATIVCDFQKHFKIKKPWSLTWADYSDRPRLSEFGGGAVVCFQGKAYWMNTGQWAAYKTADLIAKTGKSRRKGA